MFSSRTSFAVYTICMASECKFSWKFPCFFMKRKHAPTEPSARRNMAVLTNVVNNLNNCFRSLISHVDNIVTLGRIPQGCYHYRFHRGTLTLITSSESSNGISLEEILIEGDEISIPYTGADDQSRSMPNKTAVPSLNSPWSEPTHNLPSFKKVVDVDSSHIVIIIIKFSKNYFMWQLLKIYCLSSMCIQ